MCHIFSQQKRRDVLPEARLQRLGFHTVCLHLVAHAEVHWSMNEVNISQGLIPSHLNCEVAIVSINVLGAAGETP